MVSRASRQPLLLPHAKVPHWRLVAVIAVTVAVGGLAATEFPLVALVGALGILALGVAAFDLPKAERAATLLLVSGAMILGRGWANLGIPGAIPIPATEIVFIPLAGIALLYRRTRLDFKVLLPLCLYATLVGIRLLFDFPVWGTYAIRDVTFALEAFILTIGYRAVMRDGVEAWWRRMRYVAFAVLIYGAVYPFLDLAGVTGPMVGLQRESPLFDSTGVKFSVIAMSLYFVIFGSGWLRVVSLGLALGLLTQYQARTLYIMLPLALLVLGWATRRFDKILMATVPALLIAAGIFLWASANGIEGTEGPVSTEFLVSHLDTLTGAEGPNAATIDARQSFFSQTVDAVAQNPGTILVGLGLGPDLTFGQWTGKHDQLVRNPHNSYLETFARTGIVGFALWMWILFACIRRIAAKARSGAGLQENFCAWILAASSVYLGVAAAQPIMAFPYGTVPLFFLLGMGVAASQGPQAPNSEPDSLQGSDPQTLGSSAA
ncbi:hypothetical protein BH20ACT23_BH20ACT23_23500 [soil metagenome]